MKTRNIALTAILLAVVMAACEPKPGTSRKDRSTGGTTEILIVTQNIDQWNGTIGDSIRHFFLDYQYGLPQPEAQNDLMHINQKISQTCSTNTSASLRWKLTPASKKPTPRPPSTFGLHHSVM